MCNKEHLKPLLYNSKNMYIAPEQRLCDKCTLNKTEDEYHFLIEYPILPTSQEQIIQRASRLQHIVNRINLFGF